MFTVTCITVFWQGMRVTSARLSSVQSSVVDNQPEEDFDDEKGM